MQGAFTGWPKSPPAVDHRRNNSSRACSSMRDFEDSTLWRISAFERVRYQTGTSGFARLGPATLLPTTLLADLQRLEHNLLEGDALEIVAACMRHHEPALLYLQHEELVW